MKLTDLTPNPDNPRHIRDEEFSKLVDSIRTFDKMMRLRPMVVDMDGVILGGNMRYRALQHLGIDDIPDGWVVQADLTEEEKREFIIKDNVSFGSWDWDVLANEWNPVDLYDWGLEVQAAPHPYEDADDAHIGDSSAGYAVKYEIIFDDEQQRDRFINWMKGLRNRYPEHDTHAARIVAAILEP